MCRVNARLDFYSKKTDEIEQMFAQIISLQIIWRLSSKIFTGSILEYFVRIIWLHLSLNSLST